MPSSQPSQLRRLNENGDSAPGSQDSALAQQMEGTLTLGTGEERQSRTAATRRRLPACPSIRGAQEWHTCWQSQKGRHASCFACATRFEDNELRIARPADARGNASRYLHAHCVPGGFHPGDTFMGPASSDPELTSIAHSLTDRMLTPPVPPMEAAALPELVGTCVRSGDDWWQHWR